MASSYREGEARTWYVWIEQYIDRLDTTQRRFVSAKASREPREIRGTKMKTETSDQPSAIHGPISSTSSTSGWASSPRLERRRALR